jgi:hypothetical protein
MNDLKHFYFFQLGIFITSFQWKNFAAHLDSRAVEMAFKKHRLLRFLKNQKNLKSFRLSRLLLFNLKLPGVSFLYTFPVRPNKSHIQIY